MVEKKPQVNIEEALKFRQKPYTVEFKNNDSILYSLGIGFQTDNMNKDHFKYTYENNEDFRSFPTNAVTICHRGPFADGDFNVPGMPAFNPMMLLHGEESVIAHKPLVPGTTYEVQEKIADLQDKGKGALLIFDSELRDIESKELVSTVRSSLFIRGMGGFGYKGTVQTAYPKAPKRKPDVVREEKTEKNQAFLYRLCNDRNPLHVDPQMSAMGGFDVPILHGLCFYGFTARSICEQFKIDPDQIGEIGSRFTSHVFPGETLVVHGWKEGNTLIFNTTTKERGKVVLIGFAHLKP